VRGCSASNSAPTTLPFSTQLHRTWRYPCLPAYIPLACHNFIAVGRRGVLLRGKTSASRRRILPLDTPRYRCEGRAATEAGARAS